MKKYNNTKNNVVGKLVLKYRTLRKFSKIELCRKLQLHAVYLTSTELKRIEDGEMIVKDFELIGLWKTLEIDDNEIKNLIY